MQINASVAKLIGPLPARLRTASARHILVRVRPSKRTAVRVVPVQEANTGPLAPARKAVVSWIRVRTATSMALNETRLSMPGNRDIIGAVPT